MSNYIELLGQLTHTLITSSALKTNVSALKCSNKSPWLTAQHFDKIKCLGPMLIARDCKLVVSLFLHQHSTLKDGSAEVVLPRYVVRVS